MERIILLDAEDADQTLTIEYSEDNGKITFECDDGTYQEVWADQFITALKKLGVICDTKIKKK